MKLFYHLTGIRLGWLLTATAVSVLTTTNLASPPFSFSQTLNANNCLSLADPNKANIAWEALQNPILQFEDVAVKDMTILLAQGTWHLLFSHISDNPFRFQIGWVQSQDWSDWSTSQLKIWDRPTAGGLASPEIVQAPDGTYVVVFNSHAYDLRGNFGEIRNKLYYRTSRDLRIWSPMKRLAENIWNDARDRLIDAAIAYTEIGVVLAAKREQTFYLALSPNGSLDGPWQEIGKPKLPGLENYQMLKIDGVWHLLGTTIKKTEGYDRDHLPVLYRLTGAASDPQSWLKWDRVAILDVPEESWNQGYERANSAHLCDARAADGHFYLFYAGSNEGDTFAGRGHAKIGVARSRDLQTWQVPEKK